MTPRWTSDLPRAVLRAVALALGLLSLLVVLFPGIPRRSAQPSDLAVILAVIGLGTVPLTLLEGRLGDRSPRLRPGPAFLVLWPAAALLSAAMGLQLTWVAGITQSGFEGGLRSIEDLRRRAGNDAAPAFIAFAFLGAGLAAASLAALERGAVRNFVVGVGLVGLFVCFPGLVVLLPLVAFTLADALAAWLLGGPAPASPAVEELRRLLDTDEVQRGRVWLLSYLEDPVAAALMPVDPPDRELGAWLERLERAGRWACVRAALAAARLVLPGLRASRPDDLRADAVVVAVDAWLALPNDAALRDVREALQLLDAPGPAADAVRAAAMACEGTDRWATRGAAQQAAVAGKAAVAAGFEPDDVRASVREALLAWAAIPGLPAASQQAGRPSVESLVQRAAAMIAPPPPAAARWVLWREDDNGARYRMETFTDERQADDARRTFDATGHKQRYWVERG